MASALRKRMLDAIDAGETPQASKHAKTAVSTRASGTIRGRRLLTAVVDEYAARSPDETCLVIAPNDSALDAFEDISFGRVANAVERTSRWLKGQVGATSGAIVAYLGPSDIRYVLLLLAANKLGMVMFFPSPRNAPSTQRELYRATGCSYLLCAASLEQSMSAPLALTTAKTPLPAAIIVPELRDLLDPSPVRAVAVDLDWEEVKDKPFVILHTSGTTGTPKPIVLPHSYYTYEDISSTAPYADALTTMVSPVGSRCLSLAPMWHAGGVFFSMLKPILGRIISVVPPAGLPMTPDLVASCAAATTIDSLHSAPSIIADMVAQGRFDVLLRSFTNVQMGSGPMPMSFGDRLLRINPSTAHFFGSTETYLMPLLPLDDPVADWPYHRFHALSGATFEVVREGYFELVITKLEDAVQPCFTVYPNLRKFHTKDVFSPHPSTADLWKFECRLDDVITFETGEKMVATDLESRIASLPGVQAALLVGQGRRTPALLLEVAEGGNTADVAVDEMWPQIAEWNDSLPSYGRLMRNMVRIARTSFLRTSKGTVKRRETEAALQADIDRLYEAVPVPDEPPSLPNAASAVEIADFLGTVNAGILGIKPHQDDDVFARGLDSFQMVRLVRDVNKGLAASASRAARATRITPATMYSHRTTSELARRIQAEMQDHETQQSVGTFVSHRQARLGSHTTLLDKHSRQLSRHSGRRHVDATIHSLLHTVLTGSTGHLGPHILHRLIRDERVQHITCLNRAPDAREQYLVSFPDDGSLLTKVRFRTTSSFNMPSLGLPVAEYASLLHGMTTLIHNAWPVNFHLPLVAAAADEARDAMATLDAHVGGITSLINCAAAGARHPQVIFISSLSAVIRHIDPSTGCVPESVIADPTAAEEGGYAQSKWLGEQILHAAVQSNTIRKAKIIRPGQIAGPLPDSSVSRGSPGGVWDAKQAVPSLILSAHAIRAVPDSLGEKNKVRWVPVNTCGRIITELAAESSRASRPDDDLAPEIKVYNVTNLSPSTAEMTWTHDIVPLVQKFLADVHSGPAIDVVTLPAWIARVEAYGPRPENPAYKLLDFYEALADSKDSDGLGANIATERARAKSATLAGLQPVQRSWVEHWLQGWEMETG